MMGPMTTTPPMSSMSSMSSTPPPPHHGAFFATPLRTFLPAGRLRTFIAIHLFLQLISFFIIHAIFADAPSHHRLNSAYRDELATELTHARLASSRASSRLQDALQAIHILHRALRDDGLRMISAKELAERVSIYCMSIPHRFFIDNTYVFSKPVCVVVFYFLFCNPDPCTPATLFESHPILNYSHLGSVFS